MIKIIRDNSNAVFFITGLHTEGVASRCGTLHVKVVALVEAPALWPMRGIAA